MKKLLAFILCLYSTLSSVVAQPDSITTKTVVITPKTGVPGTAYTVSLLRNWKRYPGTDEGGTRWAKAIASGAFSLTVIPSGCVILAGTKPGPTPPTCTTTAPTQTTITIPAFTQTIAYVSATKSSFAGSSGGFHTNQFLTNADWADYAVTGAPVTAGAYSLSLNYMTTFDPPVYTTGQVVVNSGSPISFTATDASGGNRTAVFTGLTLNAGPNTIRVRGSSNSSNTTPFFQNYITVARASSTSVVSGTTTAPPTQTTISSPYTNSAVLAGGFAEGSLSDLLAMAPFVPSTNQFGSWAYGNSAKTVTNDTITIGWHKGLGGSLTILKDGSGPNLINNNASITTTYQGETRRENGRQSDWAGYGTPFAGYTAFSPTLQATDRDNGIGYNWVAGGSINQDTSRILHYEVRDMYWDGGLRRVTYFKTQPVQWEMHGVFDKTYRHAFYWLKGREVKVTFIIQTLRDDGQQQYRGRLQEGPFMYITAPHYRYFVYTGTNPTGETGTTGLTQINLSSPCEGAGTAGCPNQNDTGNWTSTGNWIGALDESNNGVFIVTPYNSNFVGKQFQSRSGDENSNASAYITAGPHLQNIDLPGTNFLATASYYVGSLTSFRTWYNSAGIVKMPFSFSFTPGKTNGWWSENVSGKLNTDNRFEINIGGNGGQGRFYSPEGSWPASTIDTLYIKGRFYGASTMNLQWKRPGETEIQIAQFNNKTFTVQGDGVERTYAVRMNGVTNWSGMIAFVKLTNPYPYGSFTGNEKFIPTYIGKINPN